METPTKNRMTVSETDRAAARTEQKERQRKKYTARKGESPKPEAPRWEKPAPKN